MNRADTICPGTSKFCQGFKKPDEPLCCHCNTSRNARLPARLPPPPTRDALVRGPKNTCSNCSVPTEQPDLCKRCYDQARKCPHAQVKRAPITHAAQLVTRKHAHALVVMVERVPSTHAAAHVQTKTSNIF
jgi:hypothetical protein